MEWQKIVIIAFALSTLNAYALLSLSEDHWAYRLGKRIKPACTPCRAFWTISFPECLLAFISYTIHCHGLNELLLDYFFLSFCILSPFLVSALSVVIYRFLNPGQ